MIGIVRWTVAAFMTNPDADVDELIEILDSIGVPNAERAVMFVPLAFGRQILDGLVQCPATYVDGETEHPLADEPIFVAAREAARGASRAHLERIGLTSSEVRAVNSALHNGSKPEDLVMSSPHIRLGERSAAVLYDAQPHVDTLVKRHGASLAIETRTFPGTVKKGSAQLQVDFVARVGNREIIESFAGWGKTVIGAVDQAIEKFARASLHVLMATLEREEHGTDQVTWETCGEFRVCSGALARMWSHEPPVDYAKLFDAILGKLADAELTRELHWFRIFVGISEDKIVGLDALLDNDPWPPAVELAEGWNWPASDRGYALRHFFTLIPS